MGVGNNYPQPLNLPFSLEKVKIFQIWGTVGKLLNCRFWISHLSSTFIFQTKSKVEIGPFSKAIFEMKEIYVKSPARISLSTEKYVSKVPIKFVVVNLVGKFHKIIIHISKVLIKSYDLTLFYMGVGKNYP